MRLIAIISHETHKLYVEKISDEDLEKYDGDEQAYIDDNYALEGDYSWDWIDEAEYFCPELDGMPVDINFDDIAETV